MNSKINISEQIISELKLASDKEKILFFTRFFKTGKGEYGEGDQFLGVKVPAQRKIAKKYWKETGKKDLETLIASPYHEVRLTAIFILVLNYEKSKTDFEKKQCVDFYLSNRKSVNNWDLVDSSAHLILGSWLFDKNRTLLYDLANSFNLWDQRIAIISTFYFIRKNDFNETLKISEILLSHKHDLIHKAVGWMLREVGNRDYETEYDFLKKHYKKMPRTMLRYAIEKFDLKVREMFMAK
ncbi:DNA alkylation repair protein [Aquiflexum sp.]|uniref:DNA alkylation repair protein n=1 Tax=Aquiflexum sp. TaxID=1872584 RepID=UPI003593E4F6